MSQLEERKINDVHVPVVICLFFKIVGSKYKVDHSFPVVISVIARISPLFVVYSGVNKKEPHESNESSSRSSRNLQNFQPIIWRV